MLDIDKRIQTALKAQQHHLLAGWRSIKSKAATKLTSPGRNQAPLSDEEWLAIVQKELKERQEANQYLQPQHTDHLANQAIITELETLLPQQLDDAQLDALIQKTLQSSSASSPQDIGKVMAQLKSTPGVDMAKASVKVKKLLAS